MKKLIAVFCCALCMHNITKAPSDIKMTSPAASGEKTLIKALAAIVNREGNKKATYRNINIPFSESMWL